MDIIKLARRNIWELQPYTSARNEYSADSGILLDANENSFGPVVSGPYNRYPDPLQKVLKDQIAAYKQISAKRIFLGNGSDEAIDLLIRAFCEPGRDEVLIFPPTYGMYKVCADINNVSVRELPLCPDFSIDTEKIHTVSDMAVKLIFLCSPNNPTGNLLKKEEIIRLAASRDRIVIVDEAYIDFSNAQSFTEILHEYDNLVVLQTFSKSWGLAGIRLGMLFGHPDIIALLTKIKYPYNINSLTQELALRALKQPQKHTNRIREILTARSVLIHSLETLPIVETVFPSQANFILVRFKDARAVFEYLLKNQIIVRDRSRAVHCQNCLRITVGKQSENDFLIGLLQNFRG